MTAPDATAKPAKRPAHRPPIGDVAMAPAERKLRHRRTRAEAGLVRVETDLPADVVARLDAEAASAGISRAAHLAALILRG
jgi:hypothetical protein